MLMLGLIVLMLIIAVQCFMPGRRTTRIIAVVEKKDDPMHNVERMKKQELRLARVQRRSKANRWPSGCRAEMAHDEQQLWRR